MRTLALLALLAPLAAHAELTRLSAGGAVYLNHVSAPEYRTLAATGFELVSGTIPRLRSKVFTSADGGRTLTDVSGPIDDTVSFDSPGAVFFLDAQTGWVAVGKRVLRTTNAGSTWTGVDVGFVASALHFSDASHGLAAGEGGQVKRTADGGASWAAAATGVTVELQQLAFVDAQRGWAAGFAKSDETQDVSGAVLLRTSDGGATWARTDLGAYGVTAIQLLCDGATGFVAAYTVPGEDRMEAALLRTTDGGATFSPMAIPLQVGQTTGFGTNPIKASQFLAMYWEDARRARLAGVTMLGKKSTSQSGGGGSSSQTSYIWRVLDYATGDGGATWSKTDLGSIPISFSNPPASDGDFFTGAFRDLEHGWIVGGAQNVWGTTPKTCSADAECGADYGCWRGECLRRGARGCPPACGPGEHAEGGACVADPTDPTDPDPTDPETPADGGGSGPASGADGGRDGLDQVGADCNCASPGLALAGLAGLAVIARRRRAR